MFLFKKMEGLYLTCPMFLHPLNRLLRSETKWKWSRHCEEAYQLAKTQLQYQGCWCTTICSIQSFYSIYLYGYTFTLITDHKPLTTCGATYRHTNSCCSSVAMMHGLYFSRSLRTSMIHVSIVLVWRTTCQCGSCPFPPTNSRITFLGGAAKRS